MENKSHALLAGFFTIVMLCATVLAGIWLNRDKALRVDYLIVTNRPVSGLNPEAAVRYKGLTVGRVDKINFDDKMIGQIDISISIDPETPVTKSTFATLAYQGVTGIAFVQLDDDGSNPEKLIGEAMQTLRIPLRPGVFEKLEQSSGLILANAELASERIAQFFTPENQQKMLSAFIGATQATDQWAKIANELKPTVQRMPELAQQANQTLKSVQELTSHTAELSQKMASFANQLQDPSGTFNQTLSSYGELSERMQSDALPKITELTTDVKDTLRTLNKTLEGINEHPQELLLGKPVPTPGPGEPGFVFYK
ncbi:MAG: ABC-type transport system involved in resistance to organic solvent [Solimicrobium sp.]|jgi:phospholipid/cholesterol/gamma-HCH transport system substrate-binding protein|nr:ABC-type transport system involved in resistance to organic solvent [Solimicrobium sp.]